MARGDFFSVIWTHCSREFSVTMTTERLIFRYRRDGRRPQFGDQPQDVGEETFGNGDLGHLQGDIAPMAHDLRADLDQLLLKARQRPILTWGGPGQGVRFSRA